MFLRYTFQAHKAPNIEFRSDMGRKAILRRGDSDAVRVLRFEVLIARSALKFLAQKTENPRLKLDRKEKFEMF